MARRLRVYTPVKRAPRSLLGRRRYAATTITKKLVSGRFTNRRAGGIVQGIKDEVTGSGYRLGWRTRPWI